MLAECIDRFRGGACVTCDRRDACPFGWWEQLADGFGTRRGDGLPAPPPSGTYPFLVMLGEVTKRIATRIQAQAQARTGARPRRRESVFSREVERAIEPLLGQGEVRIDRVARGLGLSRQTLYRRLKLEGVTFAGLLDGLRRRLALAYIREQGLSVKEAAWRLGFSDPAAFSRAFKRWTGASPRATPR